MVNWLDQRPTRIAYRGNHTGAIVTATHQPDGDTGGHAEPRQEPQDGQISARLTHPMGGRFRIKRNYNSSASHA